MSKSKHGCIFGVLVLAMMVGCASKPKSPVVQKPPPATRPVLAAKPVIDISRGGGGLPLDDVKSLDSRTQLVEGLRKGYERRLIMPQTDAWIRLVGTDHRRLDSLAIDLSNQAVRDTYKPSQYEAPGKPEPGISAKTFEYRAWPLIYQNGQTRWRIEATEAQFSLVRDRAGKHSLVLSDAKEGLFEFSVRLDDIKPMLMRSASANAPAGFVMKDVDVQFSSDGPRSLTIDTKIESSIFFVPTTIHMHARADIDQWCNVRLSEVSCKGQDAGGAVVAAFLEPTLEKQNEKVLPLVKWPEDRVVVKDVQIKLDESLTINAKFGRLP